jgi:hypothetical protein
MNPSGGAAHLLQQSSNMPTAAMGFQQRQATPPWLGASADPLAQPGWFAEPSGLLRSEGQQEHQRFSNSTNSPVYPGHSSGV